MLLSTLDELRIPYHVVGGTFTERLTRIVELFELPTVMDMEAAIAMANEEYAQVDLRMETERAQAARF